jgi:preprotein translocase subunit YajC
LKSGKNDYAGADLEDRDEYKEVVKMILIFITYFTVMSYEICKRLKKQFKQGGRK